MNTLKITRLLVVTMAALIMMIPTSSQAGLKVPVNFTINDSIHDFPEETLTFWKALGIRAEARGTSKALNEPGPAGNSSSFNFPITKIEIGSWMKIVAGQAEGSGIAYIRNNEAGDQAQLVLANFSIDYKRRLVIADATYSNKPTVRRLAIFIFDVESPLKLGYGLPLSVTGYEKLTNLRLTADAKAIYKDALQLPESAYPYLENTFGTLTQVSSSRRRSPSVPSALYEVN